MDTWSALWVPWAVNVPIGRPLLSQGVPLGGERSGAAVVVLFQGVGMEEDREEVFVKEERGGTGVGRFTFAYFDGETKKCSIPHRANTPRKPFTDAQVCVSGVCVCVCACAFFCGL